MLSIGDAAVRVAQDQMNSSFAKASAGDHRYGLPTGLKKKDGTPATDWCGAFVYWCYQRASAIKGEQNPLGPTNDVVLSPQGDRLGGRESPQSHNAAIHGPGTIPMGISASIRDAGPIHRCRPWNQSAGRGYLPGPTRHRLATCLSGQGPRWRRCFPDPRRQSDGARGWKRSVHEDGHARHERPNWQWIVQVCFRSLEPTQDLGRIPQLPIALAIPEARRRTKGDRALY